MTPTKEVNSIAEQLCHFTRTHFIAEGTPFDEHSPLAEAGIDSFALFELLIYGERAFGVRVPPSQLTRDNLVSVAAMAGCIARLACAGQTDAEGPGRPSGKPEQP